MPNIYIMTRQQETYLALLHAALWGDELMGEGLNGLTGERVNDVIRLAAFQGTGSLVYDQLLKMPEVEIPAELRMQMKQQCMMSIMQQQAMMPILSKAWTALEKADIHPVLLKGLALAQYYPQPHLRQWGDIDLYVGQKQYHHACKVLDAVFAEADHPPVDDEERKHYNYVFPNTVLELHRISMGLAHPCDRKYYERLEEAYLTKDGPTFESEGLKITTPEETFNVFFTFLHAWHHFTETGMNMKQLCDVAVLLHVKNNTIDRERLRDMLNKLHMLEVWQLFMSVIINYLKLPKEECPFYSDSCQGKIVLLFDTVMSDGTSRISESVDTSNMSYMKRKWITFQSRMEDRKKVLPYAPKYARHMTWGAIIHGVERIISGK